MNIISDAYHRVMRLAQQTVRRPWQVYEEDERGEGMVYFYRTREQARAHMQRVRGNQFLKGWLVRGRNIQTDEVFS